MYTHLDMILTLFWLLDLNWQNRKHFHYTKEISKCTKENMQAQRFGSHFLHIGLINIFSWPICHIFNDVSLDTHINMTYVRHLSSVITDRWHIWHMSVMTDDRCGHISYWYRVIKVLRNFFLHGMRWCSLIPNTKIWPGSQWLIKMVFIPPIGIYDYF